jgi:hypothetical protein
MARAVFFRVLKIDSTVWRRGLKNCAPSRGGSRLRALRSKTISPGQFGLEVAAEIVLVGGDCLAGATFQG